MCLQWCHVHSWLIDNDLPCAGCERGEAARLPAAWSCASCTHLIARNNQAAMCGLTREAPPLIGRCCHWQAEPSTLADLAIGDDAIAPWLAGTAVTIFERSPSAPPVSVAAGQVLVALDSLSVPLVYGVPAADWDAALGWECAQEMDWAAPPDDSQRAIIAALEALEQDLPALEQALCRLAEALGTADEALPEAWRAIVVELVALGRTRYHHHPPLIAQLDRLETDPCISP